MSFSFEVSDRLRKTIGKLAAKDRALAGAVSKKIRQIINSDNAAIAHFKNLRGSMRHLKRVHVGSFVLTFQLNEGRIIFEDLEHHDGAYLQ